MPAAFDDDGGFGFPNDARDHSALVLAYCFVVRDESGAVCDLVAWSPQTGQLARYCKTAWALGAGEYPAPLSGLRKDGAVTVFTSPMPWLASGRRGLVLLDYATARWRLARDGVPLIAADLEHARNLKQALAVTPAPIFLNFETDRMAS